MWVKIHVLKIENNFVKEFVVSASFARNNLNFKSKGDL
ncbi:hypothetical protein HMPREF1532_01788 [Bacteroides salyersiae WAL 10018 = DSM 18765 = JCM 12988]|nr:hypothetical protein HMPREF1532_01788 [Bacteroides salyersiae WAL 10018 = DSM 18765 = JCM 12988]